MSYTDPQIRTCPFPTKHEILQKCLRQRIEQICAHVLKGMLSSESKLRPSDSEFVGWFFVLTVCIEPVWPQKLLTNIINQS